MKKDFKSAYSTPKFFSKTRNKEREFAYVCGLFDKDEDDDDNGGNEGGGNGENGGGNDGNGGNGGDNGGGNEDGKPDCPTKPDTPNNPDTPDTPDTPVNPNDIIGDSSDCNVITIDVKCGNYTLFYEDKNNRILSEYRYIANLDEDSCTIGNDSCSITYEDLVKMLYN